MLVPGHGDPMDRLAAFQQRAEISGLYGQVEHLIGRGVKLEDAYEEGEWPFDETTVREVLPLAYAELAAAGSCPAPNSPSPDPADQTPNVLLVAGLSDRGRPVAQALDRSGGARSRQLPPPPALRRNMPPPPWRPRSAGPFSLWWPPSPATPSGRAACGPAPRASWP